MQRAVEFRHSVVPWAFRVEHRTQDSKFCYFSCSTECRERWSFATLSYLGPSEWNTEHKTQSSAISLVLQSAESGRVSPLCRTLGLQSGTQDSKFCYFSCSIQFRERWSFATLSYLGPSEWNTRLKVLLFLLFYTVQRAVEFRHSVVPWAFRVEHKTQSSAISIVLQSAESGGVSPRCRTFGLQSGTQDSTFCYFSCSTECRELWSFATLSYLGPSEWSTEHKTQSSAISIVLQSTESGGVSPRCCTLGLQSGAQNTRIKVSLFLLFYRVQRAVEFRHAVVPWAFRMEHRTQDTKFCYFYCSTECRERWSFATLSYLGPSEWSTEHKTQSSAISHARHNMK